MHVSLGPRGARIGSMIRHFSFAAHRISWARTERALSTPTRAESPAPDLQRLGGPIARNSASREKSTQNRSSEAAQEVVDGSGRKTRDPVIRLVILGIVVVAPGRADVTTLELDATGRDVPTTPRGVDA